MDTAVRSLTVMWDGSLVVAANNHGTCYVWRLLRGTQVVPLCTRLSDFTFLSYFIHFDAKYFFFQTMTNFEPLHKLQAHKGYILKCLLSPEFCEPHRFDPSKPITFVSFYLSFRVKSIVLFRLLFLPGILSRSINFCLLL